MIKSLFLMAVGLFWWVSFSATAAPTAVDKGVPQLTVELRDGSRVVGQNVDGQMKFHSTLLGDLKLSFENIRSVEFTATNAAKLTAANGDVLFVQVTETKIPIRTSFGKVELTVDPIRRVGVSQTISVEQLFRDNGTNPQPPFHIAYIVPAGTVGNQQLRPEEAQTIGNDFDVNTTVKITALGVFDSGGDGLVGKLNVRIYDRDSHATLADIEFTPEAPGTLVGGSRFFALKNPLTLPNGFHGTISVAYLGTPALEPIGNVRVTPGSWTVDGDNGTLSFVGVGRHSWMGTGDSFPDIQDPSPVPNNFAAGTFIFSRAASDSGK